MTSRQFACPECRQYIDAGQRWCYSHLERSGLVCAGQSVSVDQVLSAHPYWDIPEDADAAWLRELLPAVRSFLTVHSDHGIVFGESANEHFYAYDANEFLNWDDSGPREAHDISIRTLYHQKGCRTWADVVAYMSSRLFPMWWWEQPEIMEVAKSMFESYVVGSQ